jgi:hypothetical protein
MESPKPGDAYNSLQDLQAHAWQTWVNLAFERPGAPKSGIVPLSNTHITPSIVMRRRSAWLG